MKKTEVLISEQKIQERINEIAQNLNEKYKNTSEVIAICVLSGAFMFFTDVIKKINLSVKLFFIKVKSYENTSTTGTVNEILFNLPDLEGKDVIIFEDIVDTGITAKYLVNRISKDFRPKTLSFVSLFDKKCGRKIDFAPDLFGFEIGNEFIVGYGLDYNEMYRNLPYIAVLKD